MSTKKKVAILTAGGLAPCLSAAVGQTDPPLHGTMPGLGNYLLSLWLQRPAQRRQPYRHPRDSRPSRRAAQLRRQRDRQQPREADQHQGLRETRPRQGRPGSSRCRGRAVATRRRRHPAHRGRRRHQYDGGRSRRVSPEARLPAQCHRPAQDDRQRHHPDQAKPRRRDRRRTGGALFSRMLSPNSARAHAC